MQIKYNGTTRIRIEGYGYAGPGATIIVAEALGKSICRMKVFREIKPKETTRRQTGNRRKMKKAFQVRNFPSGVAKFGTNKIDDNAGGNTS